MTPADFKAIRRDLGLSAQAMARGLGVSDGRTVRRWEAGDRDIPGTLDALLPDILNCPHCKRALYERAGRPDPSIYVTEIPAEEMGGEIIVLDPKKL